MLDDLFLYPEASEIDLLCRDGFVAVSVFCIVRCLAADTVLLSVAHRSFKCPDQEYHKPVSCDCMEMDEEV